MKLDDISRRILDEHLIRVRADQALDLPEPDAAAFQFALGFLNVFDRESNMRQCGVFFRAARQRRHSGRSHQMDGRGTFIAADEHPEAGHTGKIGAFRIGFQSENFRVEPASVFYFFRRRADANSMMMKFDHFDRHLQMRILARWPLGQLNMTNDGAAVRMRPDDSYTRAFCIDAAGSGTPARYSGDWR